jgi:hypothetical protein
MERGFGWMSRFRRPARDYEQLPEALAGPHVLAFAIFVKERCGSIRLKLNRL